MGRLQRIVSRFSVPLFFLIAYAYSWACWLFAGRVLVVYEDVLQGSENIPMADGIPLAIRIVYIPIVLTATFGPAISAILLTAVIGGKAGLREFWGRIVKWRVGIGAYLAVTLLPLALYFVPFGIAFLVWGEPATFAPVSVLAAFGIYIDNFLRAGGQEEVGFRGFAQHRLRERFGPISTSLIIGVLWFFWHLPLYLWIPVVPQYGRSLIAGVLTQIAVTFLFTWVYDRTKSILMPMVLHASINALGAILPASTPYPPETPFFDLTYPVIYTLVGIVLILRYGTRAADSPRPHPSIDVGPLEPLLADSGITAIHISHDAIHYEKAGTLHSSDITFKSDARRRQVVESIVAAGDGVLSAGYPTVDCVLADGTRVHAEYEPLSLSLHKTAKVYRNQ